MMVSVFTCFRFNVCAIVIALLLCFSTADAFTTEAHFVGNDLEDKELVTHEAVSVLENVCNGVVLTANSRLV